MDRWDLVGILGLGLVATGVERLAGWPWSAILVGVVMGALYAVRETGLAARLLVRRER